MPTSSQRMELACPAGTGGKLKAAPSVIGQRRHCEARRCEGGQVAQQARGHRIAVASTYKGANARFAGVVAMSPSTDATSRGGRIRAPSNGGRNQAHQLAPHGLPRLRQPGRPTSTVAPDGIGPGRGPGRGSTTAARARVRMPEATPVGIHVEQHKAALGHKPYRGLDRPCSQGCGGLEDQKASARPETLHYSCVHH